MYGLKLHNRNFVTETRRTKEKLTSAGVSGSHLRQISEVVALHFEVKYITLGVTGLCNEVLVQKTLKKPEFKLLANEHNLRQAKVMKSEQYMKHGWTNN